MDGDLPIKLCYIICPLKNTVNLVINENLNECCPRHLEALDQTYELYCDRVYNCTLCLFYSVNVNTEQEVQYVKAFAKSYSLYIRGHFTFF